MMDDSPNDPAKRRQNSPNFLVSSLLWGAHKGCTSVSSWFGSAVIGLGGIGFRVIVVVLNPNYDMQLVVGLTGAGSWESLPILLAWSCPSLGCNHPGVGTTFVSLEAKGT